MSGQYAAATDVPVSRSRDEIERTLTRYGADGFGYMTLGGRAKVEFVHHGRQIRFVITLPDRHSKEFTVSATGRARSESASQQAWEQACRQSWRALALVVKANLEAVAAGIAQFEDVFLPYTVLPSGQTVAEELAEPIARAIEAGTPLQITAGGSR